MKSCPRTNISSSLRSRNSLKRRREAWYLSSNTITEKKLSSVRSDLITLSTEDSINLALSSSPKYYLENVAR